MDCWVCCLLPKASCASSSSGAVLDLSSRICVADLAKHQQFVAQHFNHFQYIPNAKETQTILQLEGLVPSHTRLSRQELSSHRLSVRNFAFNVDLQNVQRRRAMMCQWMSYVILTTESTSGSQLFLLLSLLPVNRIISTCFCQFCRKISVPTSSNYSWRSPNL